MSTDTKILDAIVALKNCEIARIRKQYHYAEYNYHALQLKRCDEDILKAEYRNRTGKNPDEWKNEK